MTGFKGRPFTSRFNVEAMGPRSVDGLPDPVEGAAQHIRGERNLHGMPGKLGVCIFQGHVFRTFKYLNDGFVLVDFDDTSDLAFCSVYDKFHDLVKEGVLYALQSDQRAIDSAEVLNIRLTWYSSSLCVFLQARSDRNASISLMILGEHFQPVIGHIVFDRNDSVKDVLRLQNGHGMSHGDKCPGLLYRYKMVSIIMNCFSMETQVSSLWKAFCCRNPRRMTRAISRISFWSSGRTSLPISLTISNRLLSWFRSAISRLR